jgi:hypothetical protein
MSPLHITAPAADAPAKVTLTPSSRTSLIRGTVVPCSATFTINDIAINPATVQCSSKLPDGTVRDETVTRTGNGLYTAYVTADQNGRWVYRFESTGHGQAAGEGSFFVKSEID